jgi:hypothetical protein
VERPLVGLPVTRAYRSGFRAYLIVPPGPVPVDLHNALRGLLVRGRHHTFTRGGHDQGRAVVAEDNRRRDRHSGSRGGRPVAGADVIDFRVHHRLLLAPHGDPGCHRSGRDAQGDPRRVAAHRRRYSSGDRRHNIADPSDNRPHSPHPGHRHLQHRLRHHPGHAGDKAEADGRKSAGSRIEFIFLLFLKTNWFTYEDFINMDGPLIQAENRKIYIEVQPHNT